MYPNLKLQIFRRGNHQNQMSKALGIGESVLSKIIHGYREPTPSQRELLAAFLEADESWLFEKYEDTPPGLPPETQQARGEKATAKDGNG